MSVCRCAFKYTSEVMLRLMTPLFQSRNIATLSIVFQLISQATRVNYFCGCSCRSARQSSRKVYPTANMVLEDYRQSCPQRQWSAEQVGWHKICFCSGIRLRQAQWEPTRYYPPRMGPQHCLRCKEVQYKYSYHSVLKKALVHSMQIP